MAYQRFSKLVPRKISEEIQRNLHYVGLAVDGEKFVGFLFAFGVALSLGFALNLYLFFQISILIGFVGFFIFFFGTVYIWLSVTADSKGQFVEGVLPDALQLVASNIKSGMTTERALFISARPEFGPLETELKNTSKQILAGMPLERAIELMGQNIKSQIFTRTMWLVSRGIQSGGQIADLLIQLADDIREQKAVQDENRAETSMYVVLIFLVAALGAPLLFGISTFIVQILTSQLEEFSSQGISDILKNGSTPGNLGVIVKLVSGERHALTPQFVIDFSIITLIVTSFFASLTLGVINSGKEKNGVRYIPFILIVGLALFFIVRVVLSGIFGDLLNV